MQQEFANRPGVAVVTGATGGIGAAVARMLAARGCRVVLAYRSDATAAAALAAELNALPPTTAPSVAAGPTGPGTGRNAGPSTTPAGDATVHATGFTARDRAGARTHGTTHGNTRGDDAGDGDGGGDETADGRAQGGATGGGLAPGGDGRRVLRAVTVRADLTDPAACAALMAAAGEVHTLVHAAGPHVPMLHLSRVEPERFARQIAQDVLAAFNIVHAALPALRASHGSLVAVTTAATSRYPARDGLSAVPKGAVEQLVRGIAAEEGRFGVRANCVGPGMLVDGMATRLIASGELHERALEAARANTPLRTFGSAVDIAEAVCFLAGDRARFISGQKLDVDGGYGA
ncbi:SDR family NAD(P)-dependent oxidoreductase [Dactylosporangium matsuzakiense]|uniref:NAD(P)-dependent dehydrogenase (Short-subunit alcohol dehydrogenase family) n=1 Tax=Dactylosporangium matsuzakiense TaxID=53360 RepID=A0A9W6NPG2_9ACTN|nr:SDR family NAD(P)-dependent oxidoreductase [Dactylosporangium matsuzakiense]UWZ47948.1 SDR family oxidoreductase [Dactylosporangium matsuzakiense]GLL04288.1 hypothetical protein GCM10017581_060350 [Dactylosporangium matsuzakiense]